MPNRSFEEKLGDWQKLFDNVTPHLTDMPHLARDHAALEPLLAEARNLQGQQELQKAQLRATNQRRAEIDQLGRTLRNQLAASLKGSLGLDNEKLIEFGLKPRSRELRVKRPTKTDKAEALASASAQAAAEVAAEAATKAAAKAAAKLVAEAAAA